jgi:genome maintenance exonuclease 1
MKEYFVEWNNITHHKLRTSGFIKSVCNILPNISNPLAVESSVVHSSLGYAGTVDLVAEYMGKLSVIDWKTSKKKKVNLVQCHSYPIQVSAYAGAINFDPDYPFQVSHIVQ